MSSRIQQGKAHRPLRAPAEGIPRALRRLRDTWLEAHMRPLPKSIKAATVSCAKASLALSKAMASGATTAQIHGAMDEAEARAHARRRLRAPEPEPLWLRLVGKAAQLG